MSTEERQFLYDAFKHRAAAEPGETESPFYIPATPSHLEWRPRILKDGETFAVLNPYGDIFTFERNDEGLYHQDTRYLSHFEMRINNVRPLFLGSMVRRDDNVLTVNLTNPDLSTAEQRSLSRDTLHIFRSKFLWKGSCYERIKLRNYGPKSATLQLQFIFDADFKDIFQVRGQRRPIHGKRLPTVVKRNTVILGYEGLDGETRTTHLGFEPRPDNLSPSSASYSLTVEPGESETLAVTATCGGAPAKSPKSGFDASLKDLHRLQKSAQAGRARIKTSNELLNEWIRGSEADLYMLLTETPQGPYPYAGIPWFSAPFGRDGVITALQCLWLDPSIAHGVLAYLSETQAKDFDPDAEAEPGKILHETRQGEMAILGEVPFRRYYGSVDSTPLYVLLAGAYFRRTGNRSFIEGIWPNITAAIAWIDQHGDKDGDGFVEYICGTQNGLTNQGWKDSDDAVFHQDGTLAQGPIALCEVQSYVYAAKKSAAVMARALDKSETAERLDAEAGQLRQSFENAFWDEEMGMYVLALDGKKAPCRVRTSNAGQCLFGGIAAPERARRIAEAITSPDMFSEWGVRTVAVTEKRYNPMAYHNGSIWPHDNGLIALGLARYGFKSEITRIFDGMFGASLHMELQRLPELFCGFPRRHGEGPIPYPVACSPQAWSSATVFALLSACLGVSFDPDDHSLRLEHPFLPAFIDEIELRDIPTAEGLANFSVRRDGNTGAVQVTRHEDSVDINVID